MQMNDMVIHEAQRAALMSAADVLTQVKTVKEVMVAVMKEDVHYGIVPGTKKPSLWKPGAEVLCAVFHVADRYRIEDLSTDDAIRYRVICTGTHQATRVEMGEGIGECSSNETKYKWIRCYNKKEFEHTPENRRRMDYVTTKDGKQYENMQVRAEIADVANTILKMAAKRAKIAMTLNVTAASDVFAQDLEDVDERLREASSDAGEGTPSVPQPKAKSGRAPVDAQTATAADEGADKTPASEGMLTHIKKRMETAALSDADCFKKFGIKEFAGITVAQANAIIAWTANPAA
jgi:hypothetical protein